MNFREEKLYRRNKSGGLNYKSKPLHSLTSLPVNPEMILEMK
jgi:hypothetical protein